MTFPSRRFVVLVVLDDFFAVGHGFPFAIDHSLVNSVWFSAIATQSWKYRPLLSKDQTGGSWLADAPPAAMPRWLRRLQLSGVLSQGQTQ